MRTASGRIAVIFYSYSAVRFKISTQGTNPNSFEDSLFGLLPNEVHRMVLFSLSPTQRRAVARVSPLWRFLDASATTKEGKVVVQLLTAAAEGNKEVLSDLLPSFNDQIKTSESIDSWLWLALRLTVKNGHFECMALLFKNCGDARPCFPFLESIDLKQPIQMTEEQKSLSDHIDTMPDEQLKTVKFLRSNFQNKNIFFCLQVL